MRSQIAYIDVRKGNKDVQGYRRLSSVLGASGWLNSILADRSAFFFRADDRLGRQFGRRHWPARPTSRQGIVRFANCSIEAKLAHSHRRQRRNIAITAWARCLDGWRDFLRAVSSQHDQFALAPRVWLNPPPCSLRRTSSDNLTDPALRRSRPAVQCELSAVSA